jgi:hypothetical protein
MDIWKQLPRDCFDIIQEQLDIITRNYWINMVSPLSWKPTHQYKFKEVLKHFEGLYFNEDEIEPSWVDRQGVEHLGRDAIPNLWWFECDSFGGLECRNFGDTILYMGIINRSPTKVVLKKFAIDNPEWEWNEAYHRSADGTWGENKLENKLPQRNEIMNYNCKIY